LRNDEPRYVVTSHNVVLGKDYFNLIFTPPFGVTPIAGWICVTNVWHTEWTLQTEIFEPND
jgi:hypothetical protein